MGVPIITIMIVNSLTIYSSLIISKIIKFVKQKLLKKRQIIQMQLNALMEGDKFDIA